jgi:hypothetical protein
MGIVMLYHFVDGIEWNVCEILYRDDFIIGMCMRYSFYVYLK